MTTPSYPELLSVVRREGETILAAARQGLDVAIATCGDWMMPDLLLHVGSVYHRAAIVVGERTMDAVPWQEPPPEVEDPIGYLADALDELVQCLSDADADSPAWNWWSDAPQIASFWARRMAHESAVHRYDAQRAHGVAQPIDVDIAHDGMDELIDLLLPRIIARDSPSLPTATYTWRATDDGTWHVQIGADGPQRLETAKSPDVTVRGTASALLLAAYGRVPWTSLEVEGDPAALAEWSRAFRF